MGCETSGLSDTEAAECAVDAVKVLTKMLDIPEKLSDIGLKKNDFENIAKYACQDGNIGFNVRTVKEADVLNILNKAY